MTKTWKAKGHWIASGLLLTKRKAWSQKPERNDASSAIVF